MLLRLSLALVYCVFGLAKPILKGLMYFNLVASSVAELKVFGLSTIGMKYALHYDQIYFIIIASMTACGKMIQFYMISAEQDYAYTLEKLMLLFVILLLAHLLLYCFGHKLVVLSLFCFILYLYSIVQEVSILNRLQSDNYKNVTENLILLDIFDSSIIPDMVIYLLLLHSFYHGRAILFWFIVIGNHCSTVAWCKDDSKFSYYTWFAFHELKSCDILHVIPVEPNVKLQMTHMHRINRVLVMHLGYMVRIMKFGFIVLCLGNILVIPLLQSERIKNWWLRISCRIYTKIKAVQRLYTTDIFPLFVIENIGFIMFITSIIVDVADCQSTSTIIVTFKQFTPDHQVFYRLCLDLYIIGNLCRLLRCLFICLEEIAPDKILNLYRQNQYDVAKIHALTEVQGCFMLCINAMIYTKFGMPAEAALNYTQTEIKVNRISEDFKKYKESLNSF